MTSVGDASIVEQSGFPLTFTVQGQIYPKAGSLLSLPNRTAKFLQLYFIGDEQMEVEQRSDYIPGARRQIILDLHRMLHKRNNLIKTFKTALEQMPTDEYKAAIKADRRSAGEHERRFDAPQVGGSPGITSLYQAKNLSNANPAASHISVKFENGQSVFFTKLSVPRIGDQPPNTTLIAFFQLFQKDPCARTLL
ncbi:hypothetical protein AVEN_201741-1 [Araneus ventricosus]|uniref:Helitron helicase-like domain-containing protein n=1 Tax=Araneus ventricosus TaxID=182803 RepID=A0A4Y2PL83_ARAVE|nr:hypothetical protein AVEN_201741-1 [Araneus ventricosus]